MIVTEDPTSLMTNSELLRNILSTQLSETCMLEQLCSELIKRIDAEDIWKGEMTEVQNARILGLLIRMGMYTKELENKLWFIIE